MAEEMMMMVFCEDCGCNQAICTCVCRYPLVFLCEEHFIKSHRTTGGFQHFRLPLKAAYCINSEESHTQCEKWLFGLDKAHRVLRKHCDDFDHFEQRVDAAYREIVGEFSRLTESIKEKIRATKKSFTSQLEAAIEETTLHCIEWWTPAENSLSSLIWNFASDNPVSLKIFTLNVSTKCIDKALSVNLESSFSTLCGFQIEGEISGSKSDSMIELAKLTDEMSELKLANDGLVVELEQLRLANATLEVSMETLNKKHINTLAALEAAEIAIKTLTDEVEKATDTNSQLQHQLSEAVESHNNHPQVESETQCLFAALAADAAFRKERNYQASYELLKQRWNATESEIVRLGLALCEVAMHLGRFQEAQEVLNRTTLLATLPDDLRELRCAKAFLHFHKGEIPETISICAEITKSYSPDEIPADLYLIQIISLNKPNLGSTEEAVDSNLDIYDNPPPIVLLILVAAQVYRRDCVDAEEYFEKVEQICQQPSTSIYYSMVIALVLFRENRRDMKVQQCYSLKRLIFQHFPQSFWYGETLMALSDSLTALGEFEDAEAELKESTEFLDLFFPTHKLTASPGACWLPPVF